MNCPNCNEQVKRAYVPATVFFDVDHENGELFESGTDYDVEDIVCSNCDASLPVTIRDCTAFVI